MTKSTLFCLFHRTLRFNKGLMWRIDSSYNRSPFEFDVTFNTVLLRGLLTGFVDWYIYIYLFLREVTLLWNLLVLCFGIKPEFFITLLLFIHFLLSSIWKWHALVMYSIYFIEASDASQENLCYIIWYLKIKTMLQKLFYHVLIIVKGMTMSWSPFITLCYSPFSSDANSFDEISLCLNFQWFYSVGERYDITCVF